MVELLLPKNSKVVKGDHYTEKGSKKSLKTFLIYRYDPDKSEQPRIDRYDVDLSNTGPMVLDALIKIKNDIDPSITFRRSCREGVCGSCSMNIDGTNTLACTKYVNDVKGDVKIFPLPHMPVIKDLVVDMETFFESYKKVMPYLVNEEDPGERERLQSPEDRDKFEDTTKCILCAACTTSCPVFWTADTYVGPAAIVNAHRFVFDSRDNASKQRLEILKDVNGAFRCRTAFNCTSACPKGLNPAKAIAEIKKMIAVANV